ncbi:MAG: SUMF1/EgtB/PvdO family nonheme iron enzyme [Bifidobacteriaceae bacterium]|jgi:hypothetical protein|nr:SUMF1/EgtB/PvdO family nonheme iron enzyme [Bifidobacteriaceae bacterium]
MKWDYFVSYAHEDREDVKGLVDAIESLGARCFIDYRDIPPGSQNYRTEQARAIRSSETILLIVSRHSQASTEVAMELRYAHESGRRKVAVWRSERVDDLSEDIAFLLTSVQRIEWPPGAAAVDIAQKITASATLAQLHQRLADYSSVSDTLRADLESVFRRIDANERAAAMAEIGTVAAAEIGHLWREYRLGPTPQDLSQLVSGCRDHFEHEALIAAFSTVAHNVRTGALKPPTLETLTTTLEALMLAVSTIRSDRWGTDLLTPRLRRSAQFLTGLLNEAGWLVGSQLAPRPDVVYLLFEKPAGDEKRYLELLAGDDPATVGALAEGALGTIISSPRVRTSTRFLVVSGQECGFAPRSKLMTLHDFVRRFTGLKPAQNDLRDAPKRGSPSADLRRALAQGATNLFLYGGPGTGKTAALHDLAEHGWPGAPMFRFHVDLADAAPGRADEYFDACLRELFPWENRDRARGLASFLVRSGEAALAVDSVELLANAARPKQAANAFARLCLFLSHESTVFLAGRGAAIRDAAAIRDFLMSTPSTTDRLAQVMRTRGVDSASLPRFRMIRARRNAVSVANRSRRSEFTEALRSAISDDQEHRASRRLHEVIGDGTLDKWLRLPPLTRDSVMAAAIGCMPESHATIGFDADWCPGANHDRCLLEFRAAVDYVSAATSGDARRWANVQVGEGTRRYVRLLSVMLAPETRADPPLSLVGPPGAVIAILHEEPIRLDVRSVTVSDYGRFLSCLPRWLPTADTEIRDHVDLLRPFTARLPSGYFDDPGHAAYPATTVSWWGARAYAEWSGTRLPTSLEWEIVGRGWDGRIFPWGDDPLADRINCAETLAGRPLVDYSAWRDAMRRNEVATANARPSCAPSLNSSVTGCVDMVGNVWEWTQTTVGQFRVIAGGSYDNPLRACTLSSRGTYRPDGRSNAVGFRVVTP